jgi:hypothetical protein
VHAQVGLLVAGQAERAHGHRALDRTLADGRGHLRRTDAAQGDLPHVDADHTNHRCPRRKICVPP